MRSTVKIVLSSRKAYYLTVCHHARLLHYVHALPTTSYDPMPQDWPQSLPPYNHAALGFYHVGNGLRSGLDTSDRLAFGSGHIRGAFKLFVSGVSRLILIGSRQGFFPA